MGTEGSLVTRSVLLLVLASTPSGCVITPDLDYQPPPNLPPSVLAISGRTPQSSIIRIDDTAGPDGGVQQVEIEGVIREPNPDDPVLLRVWVNYRMDQFPPVGAVLTMGPLEEERDATPFERDFVVAIPAGAFVPGCNRVEIFASRAFSPENPRAPLYREDRNGEPIEDLGVGVWWVARTNEENRTVDMVACNR